MPRYVKKPVEIEAVKWTGDNVQEMEHFLGDLIWIEFDRTFMIATLEGSMRASVGDYVIKGIQGEFYPCKPVIFEATYAEVVV